MLSCVSAETDLSVHQYRCYTSTSILWIAIQSCAMYSHHLHRITHHTDNMGGCPLAATSCAADPTDCEDYKVDIGGHWELSTTEQGVAYGVNDGTGDDAVANKDDEYSTSPFCRFDDDDANAANEWEGAWLHTAADTNTTDGSYIFEMSRTLSTASSESDAQLMGGKATDFGFGYWVSAN